MILFEKKYQTFDTVFHHQMKHLEVRQKYSAARRIFNSLLGVSSGDETLHLMFDILRQVFIVTWSKSLWTRVPSPWWCWANFKIPLIWKHPKSGCFYLLIYYQGMLYILIKCCNWVTMCLHCHQIATCQKKIWCPGYVLGKLHAEGFWFWNHVCCVTLQVIDWLIFKCQLGNPLLSPCWLYSSMHHWVGACSRAGSKIWKERCKTLCLVMRRCWIS